MLRDRAVAVDLFALVPALELRFEPELAELDRLLEAELVLTMRSGPLRYPGVAHLSGRMGNG
jgi:hypothetical protein